MTLSDGFYGPQLFRSLGVTPSSSHHHLVSCNLSVLVCLSEFVGLQLRYALPCPICLLQWLRFTPLNLPRTPSCLSCYALQAPPLVLIPTSPFSIPFGPSNLAPHGLPFPEKGPLPATTSRATGWGYLQLCKASKVHFVHLSTACICGLARPIPSFI